MPYVTPEIAEEMELFPATGVQGRITDTHSWGTRSSLPTIIMWTASCADDYVTTAPTIAANFALGSMTCAISDLHVNQRLGSGEALSLRNHDLHFVLSARFGVEHPAIRRGEDQLVGRAKLLLRSGS